MTEVKDIKGFEGFYVATKDGFIMNRFGRIIKTSTNNSGYQIVQLYKNKCRTAKTLHRFIAETFIPNPDNLPQINHKDGNKFNNSVYNLEWTTRENNIRHRFAIGLCENFKRKAAERMRKIARDPEVRKKQAYTATYNNPRSKPVLQLDLNGNVINRFISVRQAKRMTGFDGLARVLAGTSKTSGGFKWVFAE